MDPNAPHDTATAGGVLPGLPLPGAGDRHGIANGHVLAAIVDFDQATAAASLP